MLRRWCRRLSWALAAIAGLLALLLAYARWFCLAEPPALEGRPAILDRALESEADGTVRLGACWFRQRPGASQLYLEGDPFELGYANAKLTERFLERQERELLDQAHAFLPSRLAFFGVALAVVLNNASLPEFVPLEYQREIHGLALGAPDPFPELGPRYHRLLNYHAAHDISHWVADQPAAGCTGFAAGAGATRDGHLIAARNFDFEAGGSFDENKVILLVRPADGLAFLSVSWAGMAGAVTGLNERGIFVALFGAHSEDRRRIGTPVALVVREVLQRAATLADAEAIVRRAEVFVSDLYLVADGGRGEAIVIEKSPERTAVRRMQSGAISVANHFETGDFAADSGNAEYMRTGTSIARRARLAELVHGGAGALDLAAAVAILRDRRGAAGATLELGDRRAIDGLIATHSVAADVTARELWVSRGPHALGAFDAYGFADFAHPRPVAAEDPLLADGAYERLAAEQKRGRTPR